MSPQLLEGWQAAQHWHSSSCHCPHVQASQPCYISLQENWTDVVTTLAAASCLWLFYVLPGVLQCVQQLDMHDSSMIV